MNERRSGAYQMEKEGNGEWNSMNPDIRNDACKFKKGEIHVYALSLILPTL